MARRGWASSRSPGEQAKHAAPPGAKVLAERREGTMKTEGETPSVDRRAARQRDPALPGDARLPQC